MGLRPHKMLRSTVCALLVTAALLNWADAQSPPCRTVITGSTPAVGSITAPVPKPKTPAPKAKSTERGAVAAVPKASCTTFDMSKQSRQLCVAQLVSMPGKSPAVVVPKTRADLLAAGTAACKQLGRQYVAASPQGLFWSTKATKCYDGATTVDSGLAWTELLCCPAGVPPALLLPPAGGLARRRGDGGRRRAGEGRGRRQRLFERRYDDFERGGLSDVDKP